MTDRPFLSIIVPTFNAGLTVRACLASVLSQGVDGVEVLVVDGGSSDDTVDIVREAGVQWISEPDLGPYDAMNKGLLRASGKWVYFLGADDVLLRCLNVMRRRLRNSNTAYYGDVVLVSKGKVLRGPYSWSRLQEANICHQAIFYPREAAFTGRAFNLRYPVLADWALNIELFHKVRFVYLPVLVALYAGTGLSMRVTDAAFADDREELIRTARLSASLGERLQRAVRDHGSALRRRLADVLSSRA